MKLHKRDYDPMTGITEEFWYEEPKVKGGPGKVTIRRYQDVDSLLASNKEAFNSHTGKPSYEDSKGLHKIAEIPMMLIERWMREGFDWYESTDKERRAKLNEHKKLLVRPGRL